MKQIKIWFRQFIVSWYIRTNKWVVPFYIYQAIEKYDTDTAQEMLDRQAGIWGSNDVEIMRAQSYIDVLE